jgi:hypothetical protein
MPGRLDPLFTDGTGDRELRVLQGELAELVFIRQHMGQMRLAIAQNTSGAANEAAEQRQDDGAKLLSSAEAELSTFEARTASHQPYYDAHPDKLRAWEEVLADAVLQSALLQLEPEQEGFNGYRLPDATKTRIEHAFERANAAVLLGQLTSLLSATTAIEFFRVVWWGQALTNPATKAAAERADSVVPRMRVSDASQPRWHALQTALGPSLAERYMIGLCDTCPPPPPPHEMGFSFTAEDLDDHWHVDVIAEGNPYVPGHVLPAANGGSACVAYVQKAKRGMRVTFVLNATTSNHVWADAGKRCAGSFTQSVMLVRPGGQVDFANGHSIHYQVTSGWDPQTGATAGGSH